MKEKKIVDDYSSFGYDAAFLGDTKESSRID